MISRTDRRGLRPWREWRLGSLMLTACALIRCGAEVAPLARRRPPRLDDFILVERPPPVVPVDIQPARPGADAVWVPGSWRWLVRGWSWQPGAWVLPPAGATWSPWTWAYRADGQVRFWAARWYGADGQSIAEPAPIRAAGSEDGTGR